MRPLLLRPALAFAAFLVASGFAGAVARAEAPRTWGGEVRANEPANEATEPTEEQAPPAPPEPPVDARAPVEGELAAPLAPTGASSASSAESAPAAERGGPRYELEGVEVRGNRTTLARVILRRVPYRTGDRLDVGSGEFALLRYRLLGTGFFRDVRLSLRRGTRRGRVVLVVDVVERNTLVVNDLWLGLSADAEPDGSARPLSAYGGLDVAEQNLAGTGISLGGAMALADRQLALRTRASDPAFLGSTFGVEAELLYANARDFFGARDVLYERSPGLDEQDYALVRYRRFGGHVGASHELGGPSTRLFVDYRLETLDAQVPAAASHKRGLDVEPIDFDILHGSSLLSTVRGTLVHDTRDEPHLPTRGVHVAGLAEASLSPLGSDYPYAKLVVRASRWVPLARGHVLRFEGILGGIFGDAPLFEKFYVGDFTDLRPHRALDLAFDRRAAPNLLGTAIAEQRYGDYAARGTVEYRVSIYRGARSVFGVDLFGSAGLYAIGSARDASRPARGYSGFARVPLDLTFNFGLRADTAAGGISVGLANFIGFVPVRSEAP